MRISRLAVIAGLLTLLGCTRPADYLYESTHTTVNHSFDKKIVEVTAGNGAVDLFWLIGGMLEQESNFTAGADQFMQAFLPKNLDWRMAVVTDNTFEKPYLGMPAVFDHNSPQPGPKLVSAVSKAVYGQDEEMIFDPIIKNLNTYGAGFLRPDAVLAVIMTNDDRDSSSKTRYASDMLKQLLAMKGGDATKIVVYGVFGATDLNCDPDTIDSDWNYHGSEFEKLVNLTGGQTLSLCDNTFGNQLAKIGDNLSQKLETSRIVLPTRPDLKSIRVLFHGVDLPGGPQDQGGKWYFDVNSNSIIFYDLSFAHSNTESVTVQYADQ